MLPVSISLSDPVLKPFLSRVKHLGLPLCIIHILLEKPFITGAGICLLRFRCARNIGPLLYFLTDLTATNLCPLVKGKNDWLFKKVERELGVAAACNARPVES